ncbi:hypothetical protein ZYGNAAKF_CDS0118 [Enterococcus phage VRE9_2]
MLPLHHISCTKLILGVEPRPYFFPNIIKSINICCKIL